MKRLRNERGTALIATLMFLMAMGVLSTAIIFTTQNEMKGSTSYKYSQQAIAAANGGVQSAVRWFEYTSTYNPYACADPSHCIQYDSTTSPVQYTMDSTTKNVVLASTTNDSFYPSNQVRDSYIANVGSQILKVADDSPRLGNYTVTATLLKHIPVTILNDDFSKSDSAIERWMISSIGLWGPNANKPLGRAQITAYIENSGDTVFGNALWGKDFVNLVGTTLIDSYDSRYAYDPSTNKGYNGTIGTNGTISSNNNVEIDGAVEVGPNGDYTGLRGTTTGGTTVLPTERTFTSVPTALPYGSGNQTYITPGTIRNLPPNSLGDVTIKDVVTFEPGTYYIKSLTVSANGAIKLSGQTTFYVLDGFDVAGHGVINETGAPCNLDVFYAGSGKNATAKLTGSNTVSIEFYGPDAPLVLTGGADYFGSFIGESVEAKGNSNIHFSEGSLTNNITPRPFRLVTWSQTYN